MHPDVTTRLIRGARAILATLALLSCQSKDQGPLEERGTGLDVAPLSLAAQAGVYDAAVREAFDVGPQLKLRIHPRMLPRTGGFEGGDSMDTALIAQLRSSGLVLGVCEPRTVSETRAPLCDAPESGYVIRGSPVFVRNADTVQFYLHSELHAVSEASGQEPFQFEMAYQLLPETGERWTVVAEGRVIQK